MSLFSLNELPQPYPYFGGKKSVADQIWAGLGDPPNFVDPFFGSGSVLLSRRSIGKIETVNDLHPFIPNFWRAIKHDPDQVAYYADYPVFEVDLHARHAWLMEPNGLAEFRERMMTEPDYFDAQRAGYWVWGIALWIGSGWCQPRGQLSRKIPDLYTRGNGRGIRSAEAKFGDPARPRPTVKPQGVKRQLPSVMGERRGVRGRLPNIQGARRGVHSTRIESLKEWFSELQKRFEHVNVICGDWKRVLGPSVTGTTRVRNQGMTPCGVFLDPNYPHDKRQKHLYEEDDPKTWFEARDWAVEHGDDPDLRIVLAGYAGKGVSMPSSWREVAWKANGYGEKTNSDRERLWFSPHCVKPSTQLDMFEQFADPAETG